MKGRIVKLPPAPPTVVAMRDKVTERGVPCYLEESGQPHPPAQWRYRGHLKWTVNGETRVVPEGLPTCERCYAEAFMALHGESPYWTDADLRSIRRNRRERDHYEPTDG